MFELKKLLTLAMISGMILTGYSINLFAEENYLLGGDEDGCDTNNLQYCMCVPIKTEPLYCGHTQNSPVYCEGHHNATDHCQLGDQRYTGEMSQNDCLAETYQSIVSKLPLVSTKFCADNHIEQCDSSGLNCHIR